MDNDDIAIPVNLGGAINTPKDEVTPSWYTPTRTLYFSSNGHQTIGDFDSSIFPIPSELKGAIVQAYHDNHTNYPQANGMESLRTTVASYLSAHLGLDYTPNEILISGGARPLIYAVYQTILDIDDTVLYPVPSWNNDAYNY